MEPNLASLRLELLELELEKPDARVPGPLPLRALPGQRDHGRFAARHTTHELLDGVAEVARVASATPGTVSAREWDSGRIAQRLRRQSARSHRHRQRPLSPHGKPVQHGIGHNHPARSDPTWCTGRPCHSCSSRSRFPQVATASEHLPLERCLRPPTSHDPPSSAARQRLDSGTTTSA